MMKAIKVEKIASRGIVLGNAVVIKKPDLSADRQIISEEQTENEVLGCGDGISPLQNYNKKEA